MASAELPCLYASCVELGLCFTFDLHVVSAGRLVRSLIITPSFGRAMSRGLTHHHTSLSLSPGHGGRSKPPRIKPTRCFIGHRACLLAGRLRPRVNPCALALRLRPVGSVGMRRVEDRQCGGEVTPPHAHIPSETPWSDMSPPKPPR